MGQIKGLLSWNIYSKRELDNSSKTNPIRAKGSRTRENTAIKERATHSFKGSLQKRVDEVGDVTATLGTKG